jgi:hypothetical protein
LQIDLEGIVIIVGNYGSGKTEIAINLAVERRSNGVDVSIADLDLVNFYFRTREARKQLSDLGIQVVLPPSELLHADLPILDASIAGLIRQPRQLTILDAGGDDVGATVLASLADVLADRPRTVLQVVNPYRPQTETVAGCMRIRTEIEAASRLTVTGIAGNANLIDETQPEHIVSGYRMLRRLADETGLPLRLMTVPAALRDLVDPEQFGCPLLPIRRQLVPPWANAVGLARKSFPRGRHQPT